MPIFHLNMLPCCLAGSNCCLLAKKLLVILAFEACCQQCSQKKQQTVAGCRGSLAVKRLVFFFVFQQLIWQPSKQKGCGIRLPMAADGSRVHKAAVSTRQPEGGQLSGLAVFLHFTDRVSITLPPILFWFLYCFFLFFLIYIYIYIIIISEHAEIVSG